MIRQKYVPYSLDSVLFGPTWCPATQILEFGILRKQRLKWGFLIRCLIRKALYSCPENGFNVFTRVQLLNKIWSDLTWDEISRTTTAYSEFIRNPKSFLEYSQYLKNLMFFNFHQKFTFLQISCFWCYRLTGPYPFYSSIASYHTSAMTVRDHTTVSQNKNICDTFAGNRTWPPRC